VDLALKHLYWTVHYIVYIYRLYIYRQDIYTDRIYIDRIYIQTGYIYRQNIYTDRKTKLYIYIIGPSSIGPGEHSPWPSNFCRA